VASVPSGNESESTASDVRPIESGWDDAAVFVWDGSGPSDAIGPGKVGRTGAGPAAIRGSNGSRSGGSAGSAEDAAGVGIGRHSKTIR
jgi:hypothetical protein